MASTPKLDFFDKIVNVNFGSDLWLGLRCSTTGPPSSAAPSFPGFSGGTPGFGGSRDGLPVDGKNAALIPVKTLSAQAKTDAGAGFTGYAIADTQLINLGGFLPGDKPFSVVFHCNSAQGSGGDATSAGANGYLLDGKKLQKLLPSNLLVLVTSPPISQDGIAVDRFGSQDLILHVDPKGRTVQFTRG